ncbi:two-component sensor histidine kinase [Rhodococcus fascians]|jgi:signal transduction histidine kinase|uniref:sensor histidine kinase n=1 Tax=Nocardiaceae TaxID=85025 RepID=UPI00050C8ED4|nr:MULTISPECIES: histidine kinase [Rhodococcus]MDP9639955.1 signal transduction histidine kinase [Rhodococcus cercidiphylli]AMY55542.1 Sensor histidine kinase DesK [Rhodococcus fascians D188]KJV01452.1 receptor-like histidine kinase of 2 component system [Rhodococcus sp. PML026]MBJ7349368.1 two-component sensor histidine kinase [Rhodococcus sp. (in: high G+C Gram-positive bacteria)]MBW4780143.1 two-component sensor histidine kinase [Rhodococcus fascians]
MRRFSLWLRGQPFVADALLAGGLFVIEILVFVSSADGLNGPLFLAFSVVLTVPVAWRRRFPRSVAAVALVSTFVADVWGAMVGDTSNGHPAALALPIMLYTLVAYVGRAQGAVYAAGVAAYSVSSLLLFHQPLFTTLLFSALLYALSWVAAEFLGARRAYDEAMEARLIVAEYDRDRRAEEAVLMERTRIARELHDVVAHGVSVMVVQADGASYAIRRNPERAEQAVANISATGRQALAELRRTVALLRTTPDADDMPEYGTAGLARVVEMMSRAGLNVELEQTGNLDDISPAISLGVHRLVQESLTNVLRHAGHAPRAVVRVAREADTVTVEISDNGTGSAAPPTGGGGHGLVGMRERVAVLQGTLQVGRTPQGSWLVRARLPIE